MRPDRPARADCCSKATAITWRGLSFPEGARAASRLWSNPVFEPRSNSVVEPRRTRRTRRKNKNEEKCGVKSISTVREPVHPSYAAPGNQPTKNPNFRLFVSFVFPPCPPCPPWFNIKFCSRPNTLAVIARNGGFFCLSAEAEIARKIVGDGRDAGAKPLHVFLRHTPYRTGNAKGGDGLLGEVAHRRGNAAQLVIELGIVVGQAGCRNALDFFAQCRRRGDGFRGIGLERPAAQIGVEVLLRKRAQQHLADCGAIRRAHDADALAAADGRARVELGDDRDARIRAHG